jgi:hypothetical protein
VRHPRQCGQRRISQECSVSSELNCLEEIDDLGSLLPQPLARGLKVIPHDEGGTHCSEDQEVWTDIIQGESRVRDFNMSGHVAVIRPVRASRKSLSGSEEDEPEVHQCQGYDCPRGGDIRIDIIPLEHSNKRTTG